MRHDASPAWLESIAPSLLVLSTAFVLKEHVLETIEQRHMTERVYQIVLGEWQKATASIPMGIVLYHTLRDALSNANNSVIVFPRRWSLSRP